MAITLADIRGSGTPHINYNYDLVFPTIPGGGNGDVLRLHVLSTSIPGFSTETFETNHHGFLIKHAGKKEYPRTLSATFEEKDDMTILTDIRNWHDLMIEPETGVQVSADIYKVDGFLQLLNAQKAIVKEIRMRGMFPETISDITLDGGTTGATEITVDFSYDDWIFG